MLQENVVIEVERRSETGKNACYRLREKDLIPAVIYGGKAGTESLALSVPRKSLLALFRKGLHQNAVFLLQLKGSDEKRHVMVRDVTVSPLRRELIHVDFVRILLDRKLKVKVPVETVGIALGVKLGGLLDVVTRELEIECLPADIPATIQVDVSELDATGVLRVADLEPRRQAPRPGRDGPRRRARRDAARRGAGRRRGRRGRARDRRARGREEGEEGRGGRRGEGRRSEGRRSEGRSEGREEGEEVGLTELALVVGLGNPGDRYVGTRHNVGFEVLDALVRRLAADPARPTRVDRLDCRALTGRVRIGDTPVLLAKPQTYMNLSGESVKGLLVKHAVPRERMLVVSDDVALPVGPAEDPALRLVGRAEGAPERHRLPRRRRLPAPARSESRETTSAPGRTWPTTSWNASRRPSGPRSRRPSTSPARRSRPSSPRGSTSP